MNFSTSANTVKIVKRDRVAERDEAKRNWRAKRAKSKQNSLSQHRRKAA